MLRSKAGMHERWGYLLEHKRSKGVKVKPGGGVGGERRWAERISGHGDVVATASLALSSPDTLLLS